MSSTAWVILGVGAGALTLTLLIAMLRTRVTPDPNPPSGWSGSDEAQEWEEKAEKARGDFGLKPIREDATKWAGSIAALLGILSTVAFVAGPKDLVKDVGGLEAEIAAWLILAAAAVAAIGLTYAVLAGQGYPQWNDSLTGWTYRSLTEKRADKSAKQLRNSRYLVLLAVLLIIFATGIAWMTALTGDEKLGGQDAIVVTSGGVKCGTLTHEGDALKIKVGDNPEDIKPGTQITLVDSCP
jgi:hypothetical protein